MPDWTRFSFDAAASSMPAPAVPPVQPDRGLPLGREAPGGGHATVPAEVMMYLAEDHERIAVGLNDVVIRRVFAAGLDLQAALGLIGDHPAASKICHAVDELDQAIRDIRNTVFEHPAASGQPSA